MIEHELLPLCDERAFTFRNAVYRRGLALRDFSWYLRSYLPEDHPVLREFSIAIPSLMRITDLLGELSTTDCEGWTNPYQDESEAKQGFESNRDR